jgi:hypothetical protein
VRLPPLSGLLTVLLSQEAEGFFFKKNHLYQSNLTKDRCIFKIYKNSILLPVEKVARYRPYWLDPSALSTAAPSQLVVREFKYLNIIFLKKLTPTRVGGRRLLWIVTMSHNLKPPHFLLFF